MHVIFVEPAFPRNQREFVRALNAVGARVTGIGERPPRRSTASCSSWLAGYEQVRSVTTRPRCSRRSAHPGARLGRSPRGDGRSAHHARGARCARRCGIPGTTRRDGVPVPRQAGDEGSAARRRASRARSRPAPSAADEVRAFAARVGYPADPQAARRARARRAPSSVDNDARARARDPRQRRRPGRRGRRRGVHRGPRGLLRHDLRSKARVVHDFISPLLPERARGDAHALDLAADRLHEPHRRAGATTRCARWGRRSSRRSASTPRRRTWSGSSGRRA